MPQSPVSVGLTQRCLCEFIGTAMFLFFGLGVVHAAVLTDAQSGLWQIAIVWGIAIAISIYCFGAYSGAHMNPAVTIAFAVFRDFPKAFVLPYILTQTAAAFCSAAILFVLFQGPLAAKEQGKSVTRGEPGSVITAMCYGEYAPSPGGFAGGEGPFDQAAFETAKANVTQVQAALAEGIGTAILVFVIFAVTDSRNASRPPTGFEPIWIGLTVTILISVIAPLTQAGFNPARDFGPRLFAYIAGWGSVAIPLGEDWSWLSVYIIAPICGGLLGGAMQLLAFAKITKTQHL